MLKKSLFLTFCLILIFSFAITLDAQELWKPTKPILKKISRLGAIPAKDIK